jgi:hypothetical protein
MLSVVMLSVFMLNAIMLSVVAPNKLNSDYNIFNALKKARLDRIRTLKLGLKSQQFYHR